MRTKPESSTAPLREAARGRARAGAAGPSGVQRGAEGGAGARQLLPVALDTYWQVHREIAEDLYPFGVTTPQYLVLVRLVAGRREAGMRQLARAGRHDAATMTAVVDGLVRRGWVVRRRSAADRRRVVVRMTPKGRRVYQLATRRLILRWRRALRTFSGAEQLQLLSLLLRLLEALQDTAGQPTRANPRRVVSP
ncbi:MAG TPA: MarR family transcriptional regulator [Anaerolineales bacterium]|nr:MarR family transcriptional regulator [Anaerolineales bacterium]